MPEQSGRVYAILKCYDLVGEVIAVRNEPIVLGMGGFMLACGEQLKWRIEGIGLVTEVSKVTCEIMGQVTKMPCVSSIEHLTSEPGDVIMEIGPLLATIHGDEDKEEVWL